MLKPPVSSFRQRAWSPLAVSAAAHLSVLLVAAALSRHASEAEPGRDPERAADQSRRIEMFYLPPAEPTAPPPAVRHPPPPAPVRRTAPEPEPNAPPEATRSPGVETEEPSDRESAEPRPERAPPFAAPVPEKAAATMESEARRIFGRPRLATQPGAGPQALRPMEAWLPESSERCIPRQEAPTDLAGETQLGTAVGRIFRQDSGRPLAGAHLHMIGTPYVAFTDVGGEYQFRFDLSLVDNCRTQYVKVTAAGYESRLLVLVVGPRVRSEDVRLRRR